VDQPKVQELVNELKHRGFSPSEIIDILSALIQRKMMYGGDLNDSIQFELTKAKQERTTIKDYKELLSAFNKG
jgi:predicted nucleotidyltransferase